MLLLPPEILDLIFDYADLETQCLAAKIVPYHFKYPLSITGDDVDHRLAGMMARNRIYALLIEGHQLLPYTECVGPLELKCRVLDDFAMFFDRIHTLHLKDGYATVDALQMLPLVLLSLSSASLDSFNLTGLPRLELVAISNYGRFNELQLELPPSVTSLVLASCKVEVAQAPPRLHKLVFDDVDGGEELVADALDSVLSLQWTKYRPSEIPDKLLGFRSRMPPRPWSSHDFPIDAILSQSRKNRTTELSVCGLRNFEDWSKFPMLAKLELLYPTFHPVGVLAKTLTTLKVTKATGDAALSFVPLGVRELVLNNCRLLGDLDCSGLPWLLKLVVYGCNLQRVARLSPLVEEVDLSFNSITEIGNLAECAGLHLLVVCFNELRLALALYDAPRLQRLDVSDNLIRSLGVVPPGLAITNNPHFRR